MLKTLFARIQEWLRCHQTQDELSRLTDRELADIGIYRGDHRFVAKNRRNLDFLVTWR